MNLTKSISRPSEAVSDNHEKPKKVYNYFEQLKDIERLTSEPSKIKDVFFAGKNRGSFLPEAPTNRATTKQIRKEMTRSFAPRILNSISSKFGIRENYIEERDSEDNLLISKSAGRKVSLDSIEKRITIGKIKERTTILKNINQADDDGVSDEEQYVFKKITAMLEIHLTSENNPFRMLIVSFQEYLLGKYKPILAKMCQDELQDHQIEEKTNYLCQDINDFLSVVVKSMILFYNFDICNFRVVEKLTRNIVYVHCSILNFDNLMNFTTIMMFPTKIYSLVLDFLLAKNTPKDKKFAASLRINQHSITMEKLGVEEHFRLQDSTNIKTGEYIKINTKYSFTEKPADTENQDGAGVKDEKVEERKKGGTRKMSEVNTDQYERKTIIDNLKGFTPRVSLSMNVNDDAYKDAIKTLNYLPEVESPFEKMKVLLMVIRRIIKTINEHNSTKSSKLEVLTGDQIMALTVYVVLRAKVPNMFTYIEFIESFLPPKMFGTFCGYYLTVFHAACEYISNYDQLDSK